MPDRTAIWNGIPEQYRGVIEALKTTCAFTGHRPNKFPWHTDESAPACVALKAELRRQIDLLVKAGYLTFLSGMARGTDLWCASAVLAFREQNPKIKLCCVLPDPSQANRWPEKDRREHHSILNQADAVIYVNRAPKKDGTLERNRYMVDRAATVFAVYNGEPRGGTAATVRYARKLNRNLTILNPVTLQITRENLSE